MNVLLLLIIVALVIVCAVLLYALRTGKNLNDLKKKFDTELATKAEAAVKAEVEKFKAEIAAATEAAKAKL